MKAAAQLHVVVLVYDGCNLSEVLDLAHRVTRAGHAITYAGVADEIVDQSGLRVRPNGRVSDLESDHINALIIPGGDPGSVIDDSEIASLVNSVLDGTLVAGICGGVLLLAATGVTAGRSITHNYRRPFASQEIESFTERFWVGSIVEPDTTVQVVLDANLLTALPSGAADFTRVACVELGISHA